MEDRDTTSFTWGMFKKGTYLTISFEGFSNQEYIVMRTRRDKDESTIEFDTFRTKSLSKANEMFSAWVMREL